MHGADSSTCLNYFARDATGNDDVPFMQANARSVVSASATAFDPCAGAGGAATFADSDAATAQTPSDEAASTGGMHEIHGTHMRRLEFVKGSLKLGMFTGEGLIARARGAILLVACPIGHQLASQPSDGGWTCDACMGDIGRNTMVQTCESCDVALCSPCKRIVRDTAWYRRNLGHDGQDASLPLMFL